MRVQPYTREELLSLRDNRGRFNDALLDGFKLAETASVYMIPSLEAAASLNIRMPPMKTLFAVIDCVNITYLCGRLDSGKGIGEHCSCEAFAEDVRRCRHLWAVEFYINRRRGAYHGPQVEQHTNFLAINFPELRPFRRPDFTPPGMHDDQLIDHHGLSVFILLANSSLFLKKFEEFKTRREGVRLWYVLYYFFNDIHDGLEALDWQELFSQLSMSSKFEFEMGTLDAAHLVHTALKIMDKDMQYGSSRLSSLFEWRDDVSLTCGDCFSEEVTDTIEGWKRFVVPTRKMEGDMSPRPWFPTRIPSIHNLMEREQRQTARFTCRECKRVANQRIECIPAKAPRLLLIDVKQHPRWAGASGWHIPTYFEDDGKEYELVGFLTHEVGRTTRGFSAVTHHNGEFTEWLGNTKAKYVETPGRVPTIILYQRRARGQEGCDADHEVITVNPVFPYTPHPTRPLTRTRSSSLVSV